jgi:hypothetical protein
MAETALVTEVIIRTPMVKPTPSRSRVAMVRSDQKRLFALNWGV